MEGGGESDEGVLRRHYSTIGIRDVFLSPQINREQLPQVYLNQVGKGDVFESPEIVGTIKSSPHDFIVREIASDKLGVMNKIADLDEAASTTTMLSVASAPKDPLQFDQTKTKEVTADPSKSNIIAEELGMEPQQVIRTILEHHFDSATANSKLASLQQLYDKAVSVLKGTTDVLGNEDDDIWIKSVPKESSCLEIGPVMQGGDRGALHRCIKRAFCLLTTTARDGDIKVSVDCTFFGLAPDLADPNHDIEGLYTFLHKGCPPDPTPNKRKRSRHSHSSYVLVLKPGLDKHKRRKIHHLLASTRDFETSTISNHTLEDGSSTAAIAVSWSKTAKRKVHRQTNETTVQVFVLRKTRKEHLSAVRILCQAFKCPPSDLGTAGIKDMMAITYQFCTLRNRPPVNVAHVNEILADEGIRIAPVAATSEAKHHSLNNGDLNGNRFVVTVRNVQSIRVDNGKETLCPGQNRDYLSAQANQLRQTGFINFFGEQRIGIPGHTREVGVRAHDVGKAMLQKKFDEAVDLIMQGRRITRGQDAGESPHVLKCRAVWKESGGNVEETYKALPKGDSMPRERTILRGLKRYGDALEALKCLNYSIRTFWINAFQSFVWNSMASERITLYGPNVVVGDLVLRSDKTIEVVTQERIEMTKLSQVVLPLPGYDVRYPENDIGRKYQDLLSSEKVTFHRNAPIEATAKGSYRKLIVPLDSLEIDFPEEAPGPMLSSFRLSFDLPPGSYATMLLRELMVTTVTRFKTVVK